jgi:hypothetical protein
MSAIRSALVILAASAVAFGCGRSPTAPPQLSTPNQPRFSSAIQPTTGIGLLACSNLPDEAVTQVIGPDGGSLRVGPHTLVIPAGALDRTVTITAEIDGGLEPKSLLVKLPTKGNPKKDFVAVNAVRFKPKLKFETPAFLTMSYANCDVASLGSVAPTVVYTNPVLNVILEREASIASDLGLRTVTVRIGHFSNYAVAW